VTVSTEERLAKVEGLAQDRENEIKRLRRVNGNIGKELEAAQRMLDRYVTIKPADMKVPTWLKPRKRTRVHHATPVLMLSDLHLDEVVDLHEMDGINEYNREIAEQRFSNLINGTEKLMKSYVSGVHYDGIVVAMLGDIITGEIHDELARTNAAPPPASIVHWVPILASGLRYLADVFGRVFVPVVDGNHDRTYKKTPKKKRVESSFAWIIYNWLADTLRDDDRITFGISTSPEQLIDVYGTTLLLSHGDGFRSAGGVGGLYPSMLKWLLRKHQLYSATKRDFDFACIGHWHQDLYGQDFIVNGSLKGYDEYAKDSGFTHGDASQQLFVLVPERPGKLHQRLTVYAD
jgi:predicted phosphodiesterase